mgnify:CR=1 FL=1
MNIYLLVGIKFFLGILVTILQIHILGKYEFSVNTPLNQIQNYILGGIIGGVIYNETIQIPDFIAILCIWCTLVLSLKWIKKHNVKAKQLIDGKAMIIIDNGKIDIDNCKKVGLSAHDVAFKLRTNGIYSSKTVKRAVVEQNGQLIIIQAGEENPKFPIITDGQVQNDILKVIGKDEKWLLKKLNHQGINKYSEIFLGEYVDNTLILTTYNR